MNQRRPPVILSPSQVPMSLMRVDLQKRSWRTWETRQKLEMSMDWRMTLMLEVKNSLMGILCTQPGNCWLTTSTLAVNRCRQISTRKMSTDPPSCDRLNPFSRVNAWYTPSHTVLFVNRKCTREMKAPSNSTPNSEDIVTGLKANQKRVSEVLATMKSEMPDPSPYPFFSMSSSRITMQPAPISCPTISTIVTTSICEGCPQAPIQIAPTDSPKQKMRASTFSRPSASFSSLAEAILRRPIEVRICRIQPAEMMGEIPNSMRVPLLEAMITLAQQSGSASWERSMPQMGIWEQMRQMKRATAVSMVRCSRVRGMGGLATCGKSLPKGLSTFSRFISDQIQICHAIHHCTTNQFMIELLVICKSYQI